MICIKKVIIPERNINIVDWTIYFLYWVLKQNFSQVNWLIRDV